MLFQISWVRRDSAGEEADKRILAILDKFTLHPNLTVHSWVERTDGCGGFALVETDDSAALMAGAPLFAPYFEFHDFPVVQHDDAVAALAEAVAFRQSLA